MERAWARQETEEILEGLGRREEELAVIAPGDEVVVAVIQQLAGGASHRAEGLGDTI